MSLAQTWPSVSSWPSSAPISSVRTFTPLPAPVTATSRASMPSGEALVTVTGMRVQTFFTRRSRFGVFTLSFGVAVVIVNGLTKASYVVARSPEPTRSTEQVHAAALARSSVSLSS